MLGVVAQKSPQVAPRKVTPTGDQEQRLRELEAEVKLLKDVIIEMGKAARDSIDEMETDNDPSKHP